MIGFFHVIGSVSNYYFNVHQTKQSMLDVDFKPIKKILILYYKLFNINIRKMCVTKGLKNLKLIICICSNQLKRAELLIILYNKLKEFKKTS